MLKHIFRFSANRSPTMSCSRKLVFSQGEVAQQTCSPNRQLAFLRISQHQNHESITESLKKKQAKSIVLSTWLWRGKIKSLIVKDFLIFIRYRGRIVMIVMLSVILTIVLMMIWSEMSRKEIERFDDSSIFGVFSLPRYNQNPNARIATPSITFFCFIYS